MYLCCLSLQYVLVGVPIAKIFLLAEWKRPAFISYADMNLLQCDAVMAAHLENDSDDSDQEACASVAEIDIGDDSGND